MTSPTDLDALRRRVQEAIDAHIAAATLALSEVGDEITPLVDAVSRLLTGGKGLRAGFLYWGYRAAGGDDSDALVRLAASMEFFQGAALLHDDVMDRSDMRRGMPSAHRAVAALHALAWLGRRRRTVRRGRGHPRRRPLPHLVRRAVLDVRTARRGAGQGAGHVRPHAHAADGRSVPRPARVGAWVGRARSR